MNIQTIKQNKFLTILTLSIIFLIGLLWLSPSTQQSQDSEYEFFYLPTCPHCQDQKVFHEELKQDYPDLNISSYDVSTPEGQKAYRQAFPNEQGVPLTVVNGQTIRGFDSSNTTGQEIRNALENKSVSTTTGETCSSTESCSATEGHNQKPIETSLFGWDITLNPYNFSLPTLALVLGFIDGFNPCAMWVLVYLLSIVLVMENKKKAWILIGIFIFVSGFMYYIFLTAWLNVFLFVGWLRPVQLIIGGLALGVGIMNIKKYIDSGGMMQCDVGDPEEKKKKMSKAEELMHSPLTWASLLGIIGLAFTINAIEFMCSFGIPAVFTQILALSNISSLAHHFYMLLYTLMYMLDDVIIYMLAMFAVQKHVGTKYASYSSIIGGVLLILLGAILLFFPETLASLG